MMKMARSMAVAFLGAIAVAVATPSAQTPVPPGFVSIFNGKDLTGWKIPPGDNGHWKVVDGVVDYDARSEASGDKNLWTVKSYKNFEARVDWRLTSTPYLDDNVRLIMPDGRYKLNAEGAEIRVTIPNSDSGFLLRGTSKAQLNIWCWPIGSGEMYGYRTDKAMPASVKAAVTPKVAADRDIGQWNTFQVTVVGDVVTAHLNGVLVIDRAKLPGLPSEGPLALQHHGGFANGVYTLPPSLVQFRNIFVKELP